MRVDSETTRVYTLVMAHSKRTLTIWQIVSSILASFIGIQSSKNHERDARHMRIRDFLIAGILLAILLHLIIYGVVLLILPPGESRMIF